MDGFSFSHFSAISEVFVTIGVLYSVIVTMRGSPMPKVLFGAVLTFEGSVNVVYMAIMASKADRSSDISAGLKLFFAAHGTLSLIMFLALVVLYLISSRTRDSQGPRRRGSDATGPVRWC